MVTNNEPKSSFVIDEGPYIDINSYYDSVCIGSGNSINYFDSRDVTGIKWYERSVLIIYSQLIKNDIDVFCNSAEYNCIPDILNNDFTPSIGCLSSYLSESCSIIPSSSHSSI